MPLYSSSLHILTGQEGSHLDKEPNVDAENKATGPGWEPGCEDNLLSATGHLECQTKPFQVLHHLTPAYLSRLISCSPLHPTDGTGTCFLTHPMLSHLSGLPGPSSWSSKATFKAKILFPDYSPVQASLLPLNPITFCTFLGHALYLALCYNYLTTCLMALWGERGKFIFPSCLAQYLVWSRGAESISNPRSIPYHCYVSL